MNWRWPLWFIDLRWGKRKRPYPIRKREMCVCGKVRTRRITGEFVKHRCVSPFAPGPFAGDSNDPSNS